MGLAAKRFVKLGDVPMVGASCEALFGQRRGGDDEEGAADGHEVYGWEVAARAAS